MNWNELVKFLDGIDDRLGEYTVDNNNEVIENFIIFNSKYKELKSKIEDSWNVTLESTEPRGSENEDYLVKVSISR